jgi:hypothetical protein
VPTSEDCPTSATDAWSTTRSAARRRVREGNEERLLTPGVYRLKIRYEAEGEVAFQPRPRRPNRSPTAISAATVELITGSARS